MASASVTDVCVIAIVEDNEERRNEYKDLLDPLVKQKGGQSCGEVRLECFADPGNFLDWYGTPEKEMLRVVILDWVFPDEVTGENVLVGVQSHPRPLAILVLSANLDDAKHAERVAETLGEEFNRHVLETLRKADLGGASGKLAERIQSLLWDVTQSPSLVEAQNILSVARRDPWGPILMLGPSGAGKTWMVRRHARSEGMLLEEVTSGTEIWEWFVAEMFGVVEGAYSGADRHRLGGALSAAGVRRGSDRRNKDYLEWLAEENHLLFLRHWREGDGRHGVLLRLMGYRYTVVHVRSSGGHRSSWREREAEFVLPVPGRACSKEQIQALAKELGARSGSRTSDLEGCLRTLEKPAGIVFLDEVADLEPRAQLLLLKFLDGAGFRPLGYTGPPFLARVRVVAATNKIRRFEDLSRMGLREDLYWRFSRWVVTIRGLDELPKESRAAKLRQKLEQVAQLEDLQVDDGALEELEAWKGPWRGGLRQLDHVCRRAVALARWFGSGRILRGHIASALKESLELTIPIEDVPPPSFEELKSYVKGLGYWTRNEKPTQLAAVAQVLTENWNKVVTLDTLVREVDDRTRVKSKSGERTQMDPKSGMRSEVREKVNRLKHGLDAANAPWRIIQRGEAWILGPAQSSTFRSSYDRDR